LLLDNQNQPPLDFLFPDRHLSIKPNEQTKSSQNSDENTNTNKKDSNKKEKSNKQKEKSSTNKKTTNYASFNRKHPKTTSPSTEKSYLSSNNNLDENSLFIDSDYLTTTAPLPNKVNRYHFSSSYSPSSSSFLSNSESSTSLLSSAYYGSVLFNENKFLSKDKNKSLYLFII
jgi:hypothetical protein